MQPTFVTLSSSGSSPWKPVNWWLSPQQISFTVISTGGSSWAIEVCYEDPSDTFASPVSTSPTAFTLLSGSSNQVVALGSSLAPIAGYRFQLNAPSSAGASVTLAVNQSGVA